MWLTCSGISEKWVSYDLQSAVVRGQTTTSIQWYSDNVMSPHFKRPIGFPHYGACISIIHKIIIRLEVCVEEVRWIYNALQPHPQLSLWCWEIKDNQIIHQIWTHGSRHLNSVMILWGEELLGRGGYSTGQDESKDRLIGIFHTRGFWQCQRLFAVSAPWTVLQVLLL